MRSFTLLRGALAVVGGAFLLGACSREGGPSIEREDLWSLNIGRLEDEIDLFNLEGARSGKRTALAMRDGFFYVANGAGGKALRYNSYGDLLFMIYNEETNPPPLTLKPKTADINATRWAVSWPLQEPCAITVDSRKRLYVADKLSGARDVFDVEERALLDYAVLRFDAEGGFIDYLGQEGPGGRPFPRVENIYVSARDELAVVCRLPRGFAVYWFNGEGGLLHAIKIKNGALPLPPGGDHPQAVLDAVAVAPDAKNLYLKVDYYRKILDDMTQTVAGIGPDGSVLWTMDAETGLYTRSVDIPFYERVMTVNNKQTTERLFYTMFGAMNDGGIFLYIPVDNGFSILVMDAENGGERAHGVIKVDNDELRFFAFDVSAEGILSALLADAYEAKLVWWRTDRLLK